MAHKDKGWSKLSKNRAKGGLGRFRGLRLVQRASRGANEIYEG